MTNKLNKLLKPENRDLLVASAFLGLVILIGGASLLGHKNHKSDMRSASVMITNREANHGGTGIILQSTESRTSILTNDHVCRAIKDGGVVRNRTGNYQVASIIESELSDLCLVQVLANLNVNISISDYGPKMYDKATVSGHPALMPNVLSQGHVSGRNIIEVMTDIRPCTQDELQSPLGMACMFFGGMPVIKSYESVLVTATIMPGSSGSGVYNSSGELIGVVFAGSEGFGYAWTVPYEQVINFLYREHQTLKVQNLNQELSLLPKQEDSKRLRDILQNCDTTKNELIRNYCNILRRDVTWTK